jgi:hypothetical protein
MTSHSVVLQRSDARQNDVPVRFDDDRWLRYVPLRLPSTILVQERLPAGCKRRSAARTRPRQAVASPARYYGARDEPGRNRSV